MGLIICAVTLSQRHLSPPPPPPTWLNNENNSDMLILEKRDLEAVLDSYPYVRNKIKSQAKRRQREKDAREKAVKSHIIEIFKKSSKTKAVAAELKGKDSAQKAQTITQWWRDKIMRKKSSGAVGDSSPGGGRDGEGLHTYDETNEHELDYQPVSAEMRKPLSAFKEEEEEEDGDENAKN